MAHSYYIHDLSPIAIQLAGFPIRWYGLAYMGGFIFVFVMMRRWTRMGISQLTKQDVDDFMTAIIVGVIVGGRLGYCVFYHPSYYMMNPEEIFFVWRGGMSFHGGFLGVLLGVIVYQRHRSFSLWHCLDQAAATVPMGLCLGRIANFVNGELYGRVTDVSWAVIFPGSLSPRHPSQLYEAVLEGLLPLIILIVMVERYRFLQKMPGGVASLFLIFYGGARIIAELFREPDAHIGFVWNAITMGQLLSVPMVAAGFILLWIHKTRAQT